MSLTVVVGWLCWTDWHHSHRGVGCVNWSGQGLAWISAAQPVSSERWRSMFLVFTRFYRLSLKIGLCSHDLLTMPSLFVCSAWMISMEQDIWYQGNSIQPRGQDKRRVSSSAFKPKPESQPNCKMDGISTLQSSAQETKAERIARYKAERRRELAERYGTTDEFTSKYVRRERKTANASETVSSEPVEKGKSENTRAEQSYTRRAHRSREPADDTDLQKGGTALLRAEPEESSGMRAASVRWAKRCRKKNPYSRFCYVRAGACLLMATSTVGWQYCSWELFSLASKGGFLIIASCRGWLMSQQVGTRWCWMRINTAAVISKVGNVRTAETCLFNPALFHTAASWIKCSEWWGCWWYWGWSSWNFAICM